MPWKVFITAQVMEQVGGVALDLLRDSGCEIVLPARWNVRQAAELLAELPGIDATLAGVDLYTADVLNSPTLSRLKIISRWGVGYDSIDIPAATRNGVVVAYTPGLLNEAVADYTFALLCAVARRVHASHELMHAGGWQAMWGHDIHGKTLGIVGCGRIGQAVARRAQGFSMRVLASDLVPPAAPSDLGIEWVPLPELLRSSDFVSLHASLTPASRGLIGAGELRSMKRSAYFINTARGALVDELALAQALHEGWIAGAALDTFVSEPLAADHPLRKAPGALLTSHQASFAKETGERVSCSAAQAIVDLMQGRKPRLVVNEDVWSAPALRSKISG